MLKRKWSPLSPQMRILELLNAATMPMPLADMAAHFFLSGLSTRCIAANLRMLADRGCVADREVRGKRAFVLIPRGKQQLDIDRLARSRLAQRLRIEVPPDMYLTAQAATPAPVHTPAKGVEGGKVAVTPSEPHILPTPGRFERLENREEVIAKPLVSTALIARRHLRALAARALAAPMPLTDDDRAAIAAAIQEAA